MYTSTVSSPHKTLLLAHIHKIAAVLLLVFGIICRCMICQHLQPRHRDRSDRSPPYWLPSLLVTFSSFHTLFSFSNCWVIWLLRPVDLPFWINSLLTLWPPRCIALLAVLEKRHAGQTREHAVVIRREVPDCDKFSGFYPKTEREWETQRKTGKVSPSSECLRWKVCSPPSEQSLQQEKHQ